MKQLQEAISGPCQFAKYYPRTGDFITYRDGDLHKDYKILGYEETTYPESVWE